MDDDRPRGRRRLPDDIRREVLFDPGEGAAIRLLGLFDLVEDADRGHRVVGRVYDVIAHEAGNSADDRHGALDDLGEVVRHTRLGLHLTNRGVHRILPSLHAAFAARGVCYAAWAETATAMRSNILVVRDAGRPGVPPFT